MIISIHISIFREDHINKLHLYKVRCEYLERCKIISDYKSQYDPKPEAFQSRGIIHTGYQLEPPHSDISQTDFSSRSALLHVRPSQLGNQMPSYGIVH